MNSLLGHTASLTSTLADRDEVIGRTIDNLNAVLGTVDERDRPAVDPDHRAAAVRQRPGRGPRGDRRVADEHREPGRRDGRPGQGVAAGDPQRRRASSARWPAPSTTTRRSSTGVLQRLPEQAQHHHPDGDLRLVVQLLPLRLHRPRDPLEHDHVHAELPRLGGEVQLMAGSRRMARPGTPFRERNPVVIGAVGLGVIAALLLLAFNIDNIPLLAGRSHSAALSEAGGLKAGDDVRIAGVKVGKVTAVDLDGDHVRVDFRVGRDTELGSETSATVRIKTILGQKYLALEPAGKGELTARDPAVAHHPGVRRGGGVQRPRDDHRRDRHRPAGRVAGHGGRHLPRLPGGGPRRGRRAGPAVPHDRLPRRPAARAARRTPTASPACWPTATSSSSRCWPTATCCCRSCASAARTSTRCWSAR